MHCVWYQEQNLFQVLHFPTPSKDATAPRGPGIPHYRGYSTTIFRHTTLSTSPLDEWSARSRDLYLTKHNTDKRQISMSVGGIRTHSASNRKPADPSLRHHGHWDRINPLNAELNPICHLLVLLGDLTFMGPCIVSISQHISNKIQRYTVYYIWKMLYMFRGVLPPIIRSAYNCIYSIWYLSHRCCYLPL